MTEEENIIELARMKFMQEVDRRFTVLILELDSKGTEHSRVLEAQVIQDREKAADEFERVWSFTKSKLVSIEMSQQLFYNELYPRLMKKTEEAVKMSRDAAGCTKLAADSARDARASARSGVLQLAAVILTVMILVITVLTTNSQLAKDVLVMARSNSHAAKIVAIYASGGKIDEQELKKILSEK